MIVTSTTETVPFTPAWLEGTPNAPVFHLRAGSVIERGQMEAELAGTHRAGRIFPYELMIAIRSGIATLLADDPELDRVQALIEAETVGETEDMSEEDKRLLVDMRSVLAEHWPDYRDLVAQTERRKQIAPIVALRRFCTGWENVVTDDGDPVDYERGRDGQITEAALARLQPFDLLIAGNRAYALQYAADHAGNSERPLQSENGPTTSPSDAPSTKGGISGTSTGKRTRASRSPRGSGRS